MTGSESAALPFHLTGAVADCVLLAVGSKLNLRRWSDSFAASLVNNSEVFPLLLRHSNLTSATVRGREGDVSKTLNPVRRDKLLE